MCLCAATALISGEIALAHSVVMGSAMAVLSKGGVALSNEDLYESLGDSL